MRETPLLAVEGPDLYYTPIGRKAEESCFSSEKCRLVMYRNKVGYVVDYPANLSVTNVIGEAPAAQRFVLTHYKSATVLFQNIWS